MRRRGNSRPHVYLSRDREISRRKMSRERRIKRFLLFRELFRNSETHAAYSRRGARMRIDGKYTRQLWGEQFKARQVLLNLWNNLTKRRDRDLLTDKST